MKRLGDFGSQSAVLKSAALGSPEKFLDMPSISPTLGLQKQKTWEWGPAVCVLHQLTGDLDAC